MVGPQFQADLSNLHLNRHGEKSKWGLDHGGDREKKMKTPLQSRGNLLHIQSDLVPKSSEGLRLAQVPALCQLWVAGLQSAQWAGGSKGDLPPAQGFAFFLWAPMLFPTYPTGLSFTLSVSCLSILQKPVSLCPALSFRVLPNLDLIFVCLSVEAFVL